MLLLNRHPMLLGKESGYGDLGYIATADQLSAFDGDCSNRKAQNRGGTSEYASLLSQSKLMLVFHRAPTPRLLALMARFMWRRQNIKRAY